jgi:branched-chain amino acid aminotransferase
MSAFIVYLNGKYVPDYEAVISVFDRGYLFGDSAYDTTRTFKHTPFKLESHVSRLFNSLKYISIELGLSQEDVMQITLDVIRRNRRLLNTDEDYWVTQRVSRGRQRPGQSSLDCREHTLIVYIEPLPFISYAHLYAQGARLITPSVRRTPPECISPRAKLGNKLNHILAQIEAKRIDPGCFMPLMLDTRGFISETDAANLFVVSHGRLVTPHRHTVLEGISRDTVIELAGSLEIPCSEGDLTLYDLYMAEEAFITATSYCVLPVTSVNGRLVGAGVPGPITASVLQAWSKLTGVDIAAQATRNAKEADTVSRNSGIRGGSR